MMMNFKKNQNNAVCSIVFGKMEIEQKGAKM